MDFKTKLTYASLFAFGMLIVSMLFPIIICQTAPNVPNPSYTWSMCRLNPDAAISLDSITYYFGYTKSITESYLIVLIVSYVLVFVFFHLIKRKKKKH